MRRVLLVPETRSYRVLCSTSFIQGLSITSGGLRPVQPNDVMCERTPTQLLRTADSVLTRFCLGIKNTGDVFVQRTSIFMDLWSENSRNRK